MRITPTVLALTVALATGGVLAEPTTESELGGPVTNIKGLDKDVDDMTIDEMVNDAGKKVTAMQGMLSKSFKLLQAALESGDVTSIPARNEAISPMKGLVKLAEQNYITLQAKAVKKDRDGVVHEYVKITIAHSKVGELYSQVVSAGGIDLDPDLTDVDVTLTIGSDLAPDEVLMEIYIFVGPDGVPEPVIYMSPYF